MDAELLRHYTQELGHLREVGAEFAREFPKIAARLGMENAEVADPFVERLLEGFAFLAARVQCKLDAEHPRLIAHLIESLSPGFLAPVPSMAVARLAIDAADPNLVKGHVVPRGSALLSQAVRGQGTRCELRTAHAVTLWPIALAQVQYFSHAPDLPLQRLPGASAHRGGLRIRLRTGGGLRFDQLGLDRLAFYISAPPEVAYRLHALLHGAALGSWIATADGSGWRGADSVQPLGHHDDQALLPETHRNFSGCRLLQELAALPQRFLFFEVADLAPRLATVAGDQLELVLPFDRADPGLEALVDADCLALHCTPAINLFPKRLDRIQLGPGQWQYHVVPDRTRPMDFEVHGLQSVVGHGAGALGTQEFRPLYATYQASPGQGGYYTVQRQPRMLSARQQEHGPRASYVGDEVWLALVDPQHAPYREDIRQLSVAAWVTNRDLPLLLPAARADGPSAWQLDTPGPVQRVELLAGPTRPMARQPVGAPGWSLVGLLTLARLPWADEPPDQAAATLQRLLRLWGPPDGAAWQRQVDGVRALTVKPAVARLPGGGRIAFGSGCDIELELDELAFQGGSAYLLASVLEHYFARHASVNTFTRLSLRTPQRGLVRRWPARVQGAFSAPPK